MTSNSPATFVLAAMMALGVPAAARADLMTACGAEISSFCSDVSDGRGRIAACLVANGDKLGAACTPEVAAVTERASGSFFVPSGVRNLLSSDAAAPVPQACSADVERFCPEISPGENRVLACLYARTNQVSATCSAEAQRVLN